MEMRYIRLRENNIKSLHTEFYFKCLSSVLCWTWIFRGFCRKRKQIFDQLYEFLTVNY